MGACMGKPPMQTQYQDDLWARQQGGYPQLPQSAGYSYQQPAVYSGANHGKADIEDIKLGANAQTQQGPSAEKVAAGSEYREQAPAGYPGSSNSYSAPARGEPAYPAYGGAPPYGAPQPPPYGAPPPYGGYGAPPPYGGYPPPPYGYGPPPPYYQQPQQQQPQRQGVSPWMAGGAGLLGGVLLGEAIGGGGGCGGGGCGGGGCGGGGCGG